MDWNLTGRRALVCGSTQGIGRAIATELARHGASITLLARNEDVLKKTVGTLPQEISNCTHDYIVADFSRPDEVKERVATYLKSHPSFQILINNTGGPPSGELISAEVEALQKAFSGHLICNHYLAQLVVPGMKEEGYGRIINVVSTSVKQPLPGLGVSNTIRGAVASWAKTLSNELGPHGITVNNILPGATETGRLSAILENRAEKSSREVSAVKEEMLAEIPLRRFGQPEEIAFAACFLASPLGGYISGVSLPVDGGRTSCL